MIALIVVVIALGIVFYFGYLYTWDWTGVNGYIGPNVQHYYQPEKTLWDWLTLIGVLAIPIVVGFGAVWFTEQQAQASAKENKDNQQEAALQAYIDKMSKLLLKKKGLRESQQKDEVCTIARVRTLTVLRGLDATRKANVLQFLYEAKLIENDKCFIDLQSADLSGVDLSGVDPSGTRGAIPHLAILRGANLTKANLTLADLSGADLTYAKLYKATLSGTNLSGAQLKGAILNHAKLCAISQSGSRESRAFKSDPELWRARHSAANLSGADLSGAHMHEADLSGADLRGVILDEADLSEANLKDAKNITTEELEMQAKSLTLKGTTTPDGRVHS